ncbi:MAG: hypothetical protein SVW57_15125, partial [Thermodesulfobacteriota bacterium]|nr:hypothetical protein [Thermodesulfobacteriota bacterium]
WSWGFDGEERRQDWTKPMTKTQIAKDINMHKQHTAITINEMIAKNILFIKNDCYQFNEHPEKWKSNQNSYPAKVTKTVTKSNQNSYSKEPKQLPKVTKTVTQTPSQAMQDKAYQTLKETIKKLLNKNKEYVYARKEKVILFDIFWEAFKDKRGKEKALKAWTSIKLTPGLFDKIVSGAKAYAKERVNILARQGTPKMAQGWLNDKRWEDEIVPQAESNWEKRLRLGRNENE